jgi:hypothetical protein
MAVTEQIIEVVERGRKLGLTDAELDQMLCAIECRCVSCIDRTA